MPLAYIGGNMVYIRSFESILTIVVMFMAGYLMAHVGWLDDNIGKVFTKIILNVSLPCYMIWNIMTNFTRTTFEQRAGGLVVPFLSIGMCYLLGVLFSLVFRVKKNRRGIFRSVFFTSNTIFIGLPVNLELFGPKSVPFVLLYYIANTSFFWTIGSYEISRDGQTGNKRSLFTKETLRRLLSPALLGFITAVLLVLLNVQLPVFVMNSCKYLGELTTPLAMLFIGIVLHSVHWRALHLDKDVVLLLFARFLICPLTIYVISAFIPLTPLMRQVFVIQSAMPAMTSTGIVAKEYGADYEFATVVTVITTLVSMLVIPVYMAIGA